MTLTSDSAICSTTDAKLSISFATLTGRTLCEIVSFNWEPFVSSKLLEKPQHARRTRSRISTQEFPGAELQV